MSVRERTFAAVYDPMNRLAEEGWLGARRHALLAEAAGAVLEVGAGTGANLAHYPPGIDRLVLAEPSEAMLEHLDSKLDAAPVPATTIVAGADDLPYPDGMFDTVVSTLVLCTVADVDAALTEIRRVLKPGGRLLFLEHVRGEARLADWQDRLQPIWTWFGVGCRPNRDTVTSIETAGFDIESLERFDAPVGPLVLVKPQVQGIARRP